MVSQITTNKRSLIDEKKSVFIRFCLWTLFAVLLSGCNDIKSPSPDPFVGENAPAPQQEFRWSNGKMPKSLDPARAAAAPETDVVRAIYEGLTDVDSKTLKAVPALATKWVPSTDFKTWTFQLRRDAKWTNGETINSQNFVDSWKRLAELGDKVPQRSLLKNIVGMDSENVLPIFAEEPTEESERSETNKALSENSAVPNNANANSQPTSQPSVKRTLAPKKTKFGIEALGDFSLKITLVHPDQDFPLLVAHPVFRPIYGDGEEFEKDGLDENLVTDGAFKLKSIGQDGIVLERSTVYWNKNAVLLDAVRFVPTDSAESALNAYREGKIDALTNASFQPLALKLLKPFKKEFRQTTHGALNFYEFNMTQKPFDDSRVRKALAIAIEREHLTEDEMDGVSEPALSFLPFEDEGNKLAQSVEKGRKLLTEAGFPGGENFPVIKLVVNRNNVQQKIAKSIAGMWLKNLNVKTEIVVKDQANIKDSIETGDYGLVRRGIVLPTNDETSNMLSLFHEIKFPTPEPTETETPRESENSAPNDVPPENGPNANIGEPTILPKKAEQPAVQPQIILTETQALEQLPGIPLYFPTSYSLVKPYVEGFELNAFDATSLENVRINRDWKPVEDKPNSTK